MFLKQIMEYFNYDQRWYVILLSRYQLEVGISEIWCLLQDTKTRMTVVKIAQGNK